MRSWMIGGGLLAVLVLPGCENYDTGYGSRPVYAAYPSSYASPYYHPAPAYYYAPAPRSYFSFGFSTGHRHGHHHRHRHPRHGW